MTTTVKISGMSCGHCVAAVKSVLQQVEGVTSLDVKLGEAVIESAGELDTAAVKHAIEEEGFQVLSLA